MPRAPRTAHPPAERLFRALSDRTRLRILSLLRGGELCVGDLIGILRLPQPTVSRHLAYLRRCGLVTARARGLWMFYALAPVSAPTCEVLERGLELGAASWPGSAGDARRLAAVRCGGGCCPLDVGGGPACRS
jgi:ArsR family transcriptional regulator